jgi:type III secretory pathway component EscR
MYKSRFRYIGHTGFILFAGFFIVLLTAGFAMQYHPSRQEIIPFISIGSLLLVLTIFVWRKIFVEMNQITITGSTIELTNLFTRRAKKIEKTRAKGYKDILKKGYTVLIIDENDQVWAKIHDYYYLDFKALVDNLGLKHLERIPTFMDKFVKVNAGK